MFTRREFLQTTLIALAMPAAAAAMPPAAPGTRARLIAIGGCLEGDAFCAANLPDVTRVGPDVGEILQLLLRGEHEADVGLYCGLTRDSDFVLIRQVLLERGLRQAYLGDHVATPTGWRHELRADAQTLERILPAFASDDAAWAGGVAACCGWFARAGRMSAQHVLANASYARPAAAATQLKSWAFRP